MTELSLVRAANVGLRDGHNHEVSERWDGSVVLTCLRYCGGVQDVRLGGCILFSLEGRPNQICVLIYHYKS